MSYTRSKRGLKKTLKYGGRRNYNKGSLRNRGKRTMKNVGGGIFSKCRGCLPPSLSNKNKFLQSDTIEQIEVKLRRMYDDQTPDNIRRFMVNKWLIYLTTDTPHITLERKSELSDKVVNENMDKLNREMKEMARNSRIVTAAMTRPSGQRRSRSPGASASASPKTSPKTSPKSSPRSGSRSGSRSPTASELDAQLAEFEAQMRKDGEDGEDV